MRHSTITLTLDTYGHLLEGAESAAIHHTADLTSVPEILTATGTDPKLAQRARPLGMRGAFSAVANIDFPSEDHVILRQEENREILRENAVLCVGSRAEDKGFEPSTGFPAPDFESGPKREIPHENKGPQNLALRALQSPILTTLKAWLSECPIDDENLKTAIERAVLNLVGNADQGNSTPEAAGIAPECTPPTNRRPSRQSKTLP